MTSPAKDKRITQLLDLAYRNLGKLKPVLASTLALLVRLREAKLT